MKGRQFSRLFALALLIACYHLSTAQDYRAGYIVGLNGDTTKGFVRYATAKRSERSCIFKPSRGASKQTYQPGQIRGYGIFGDRYFAGVKMPGQEDKVMFARVLAFGSVGLLSTHKQYLLEADSVIALPPPVKSKIAVRDGQAIRVEKPHAGILNIVLAECGRADNVEYSEDELTTAIDQFNRCKDPRYKSIQRRPTVAAGVSIFASYIYSDLQLKQEGTKFEPSTFVAFGAGFDLSSPRLYDKLSLAIDVSYADTFYQGLIEGPGSGYYLHEDVYMSFQCIRLAGAVRFNLMEATHTPYFKIGFADYFVLQEDIHSISEQEFSKGVIITSESTQEYTVKNPKGIYLGLGYQQAFSKKFKFFIEGRYENLEGFVGTQVQSFSDLRNYNATFGLRFN